MISGGTEKAYIRSLLTGERLARAMARRLMASLALAAALAPGSAWAVSLNQVLIDNFLIDGGDGVVDPGNMLAAFECTSATSANVTISFTTPFNGSFVSAVSADEVIDECAGFDDDDGGGGNEEEEPEEEEPEEEEPEEEEPEEEPEEEEPEEEAPEEEAPEEEDPNDEEAVDPPVDDQEARDRAEIIDQLVDFGVTLVPGAFNPNAIGVLNIPPLNNDAQVLAGVAAANPAVRDCLDELNRLKDQLQALQDEKQRLAGPPPQPADITEDELQEDPDFQQLADARRAVQAFTTARNNVKAQLDSRQALIDDLTAKGTIDRKLTEENANRFGGGDPALVQAGRGNDDRIRGIQSAAAAEFGVLVATRVATANVAQLAGFAKNDGFEFAVNRGVVRGLTRGLTSSRLSNQTAKAIQRAKKGFKGSKKATGEAEAQERTDRRAQDNQEVKAALLDAALEIAPGAFNPLELVDQFNSVADRLDGAPWMVMK